VRAAAVALILGLGMGLVAGRAHAQTCPDPTNTCGSVVAQPDTFPRIHFRAIPGVIGSAGQDSTVSRKATLVWNRDLALEQRLVADTTGAGFGGYNIYRVFTNRDTCKMELLRRYVYKDTLLWHFRDNQVQITFVDPDSAGNLVKQFRCLVRDPTGRCTRSDSIFVLKTPPPPPDGFPVYYAIVYAADPARVQGGFEDLFVPDLGHCGNPGDLTTCCNMNTHSLNLMQDPIFLTPAPTADLEHVIVVPNPYRGSDAWDPVGTHHIEFRNLPTEAKIQIYTVAGDLVRELQHKSQTTGGEFWDLKNGRGRDVGPGIYIYRSTTPAGLERKNHLVIVR